MIYTVKTIIGRENLVVDNIASKAQINDLDIKVLVHPEEIRGYVFVEGDMRDIETAIKEIPHARGIIRKPVPVEDIKRFLEPKKVEIEINEGDIVEVIGGPFKGERGKVKRYDEVKREVTIELIEVTVPIPVTVDAGLVKVVKKNE
ncbi:MAG: transcription elongation factor Spt5 [Candidatus Aenigmarchaeota archaeon]|nr:transcription elongation factor Spt5 [Candidatus Aenigmarchaeota archaeon]